MSLLLLEGFETDDWFERAVSASSNVGTQNVNGTYVRTGAYSMGMFTGSAFLSYALPEASPTTIVGMGIFRLEMKNDDIFRFLADGGVTEHIVVRMNSSGALFIDRGVTNIASTAAGVLGMMTWYYMEVKAYIHDTLGTVEVKLDGTTVLSFGPGDTKNGGTAANPDLLTITAEDCFLDDVYVFDGAGTVNNDFAGPLYVEHLLPNGNGNYSQLVGSDADSTDNYLLVDEVTPINDADYVGSPTSGQKDTYSMDDLSAATATIIGVEARMHALSSDGGAVGLRAVHRRATVDSTGADHALNASSDCYPEEYDLDPNGSIAWTVANVNASEFGAEVRP